MGESSIDLNSAMVLSGPAISKVDGETVTFEELKPEGIFWKTAFTGTVARFKTTMSA